jgi:hypothetical protein
MGSLPHNAPSHPSPSPSARCVDGAPVEQRDFFISRAGKNHADVAMAQRVGKILTDAGHTVWLQDRDFKNKNFMAMMNASLASGARVISILTPEDPETAYCEAERSRRSRAIRSTARAA